MSKVNNVFKFIKKYYIHVLCFLLDHKWDKFTWVKKDDKLHGLLTKSCLRCNTNITIEIT